MVDFAKWVTACETAFWPAGTFLPIYLENIAEAKEKVIEADLIGNAVRELMQGIAEKWTKKNRPPTWEGTASDLLTKLVSVVGEATTEGKSWPKTASVLGTKLRNLAPALQQYGIKVEESRVAHQRNLCITFPHQSGGLIKSFGFSQ